MKRYYYSFRQNDVGYFFKPNANDLSMEDAKVSCKRDVVAHAPDYIKNGVQNCSFCYCGYFDDETGLFVSPGQPVELISQAEMMDLCRRGVTDVSGTSQNGRD